MNTAKQEAKQQVTDQSVQSWSDEEIIKTIEVMYPRPVILELIRRYQEALTKAIAL